MKVPFPCYRNEIRGIEKTGTDQLFKEAIQNYQQVSQEYLNPANSRCWYPQV